MKFKYSSVLLAAVICLIVLFSACGGAGGNGGLVTGPQITLNTPANGATGMATTCTLTWTATGTDSGLMQTRNATITEYRVYFCEDAQGYSYSENPATTTQTEYSVQGLKENTTYKWQIEVVQEDGQTKKSPERTFTTVQGELKETTSSATISATEGGEIELESGVKLVIPEGTFDQDTHVEVIGANQITSEPQFGIKVDTNTLNKDIELQIPLGNHPELLERKFYMIYFDDNNEAKTALCAVNNINGSGPRAQAISIPISLVGTVWIYALNETKLPEVIGVMRIPGRYLKPGDLLYKLGNPDDLLETGHVMLHSEGNSLIHATPMGDTNTLWVGEGVTYGAVSNVINYDNYAGARRPKTAELTDDKRTTIINYAKSKIGTGLWSVFLLGVKDGYRASCLWPQYFGREVFSCVGLAEKAYQEADIDLVGWTGQFILFPNDQFAQTVPVDEITIYEETGITFEVNTLEKGRKTSNVEKVSGVGTLNGGTYSFYPKQEGCAPGDYQVTFKFSGANNKSDTQTLTMHVLEGIEGMTLIKAGTFQMGDEFNVGDSNEKPIHSVTLTNDYYLGTYEVTNSEFVEFLNSAGVLFSEGFGVIDGRKIIYINLDLYSGIDYKNSYWYVNSECNGIPMNYAQMPVGYVTWIGAVEYCNWLSNQKGISEAYIWDNNINTYKLKEYPIQSGYRLPTEAEWEYAARGGQNYMYAGTSDNNNLEEYAWTCDNSDLNDKIGNHMQPVGQKLPNGYNLYDMSGNIEEWCTDNAYVYTEGSQIDPYYQIGNNVDYVSRLSRGGSFYFGSKELRVANRSGGRGFNYSNLDLGLRLARTK